MTDHAPRLAFGEAAPEIIRILERSSRWILLSHTKPDGDTLGCCSAFRTTGLAMGKEVLWGGPDPVPDIYSFLPGTHDFIPGMNLSDFLSGEDTAVIVLDTATAARSVEGLAELPDSIPLINIDHHKDNEGFGTVAWIDQDASSVGEMCWMLFQEWGTALSLEAAEALYTAIVTDSGNFSFAATTPRTHQAAAGLLALGVKPAKLEQLIKCSRTPGGLRLRGAALKRVENAGPYAAITWISREDFIETGGDPSETESLVNELLTIRTASFAALLIEEEDGVRASLRSRGGLSASEAARTFGGGGHLQAAGCTLPLPLEGAVAAIRAYLEKNNVPLRSISSE
ncbi:MAG: DHH family phosphoesterase [Aminivibrio sp.]|jgi:phosphoesterase RecJ-like protein